MGKRGVDKKGGLYKRGVTEKGGIEQEALLKRRV